MSMVTVNINHIKTVPSASSGGIRHAKYIAQKAGDVWLYDNKAKCHCIIKDFELSATSKCLKFTCKIDIK